MQVEEAQALDHSFLFIWARCCKVMPYLVHAGVCTSVCVCDAPSQHAVIHTNSIFLCVHVCLVIIYTAQYEVSTLACYLCGWGVV